VNKNFFKKSIFAYYLEEEKIKPKEKEKSLAH
jgi:hypothetical protein